MTDNDPHQPVGAVDIPCSSGPSPTRLHVIVMPIREQNAITKNAKELAALGERMTAERAKPRCEICSGPIKETRYPRYGGEVYVKFGECEWCGNETWPVKA